MATLAVPAVGVELVSPFPLSAVPLLWKWANEFPDRNFDDSGPQTESELFSELARRLKIEWTWGVRHRGELVGFVAYLPMTKYGGTLHGVCFAKAVHGTGVAKAAMCQIVKEIFASGVRTISAGFFATTPRIEGLLRSVGFIRQGRVRNHYRQHGKPLDMIVMAAFAPQGGC